MQHFYFTAWEKFVVFPRIPGRLSTTPPFLNIENRIAMNKSSHTKRCKGLNAPANSEKPKRTLSRRKYRLPQEEEDLKSRHFYNEMMFG
jgi:hypothetical protein